MMCLDDESICVPNKQKKQGTSKEPYASKEKCECGYYVRVK